MVLNSSVTNGKLAGSVMFAPSPNDSFRNFTSLPTTAYLLSEFQDIILGSMIVSKSKPSTMFSMILYLVYDSNTAGYNTDFIISLNCIQNSCSPHLDHLKWEVELPKWDFYGNMSKHLTVNPIRHQYNLSILQNNTSAQWIIIMEIL